MELDVPNMRVLVATAASTVLVAGSAAHAIVVQAVGFGSAVSRMDARADFEPPVNPTQADIDALGRDRFNFEDGLRFDRVLEVDPNRASARFPNFGCGVGAAFAARCGAFTYPYGFTGNAYAVGSGLDLGAESCVAEPRQVFHALDFRTGAGSEPPLPDGFFIGTYWRAFNSTLDQAFDGFLTHVPGKS